MRAKPVRVKIISYAALIFIIALIQSTVLESISIFNIKPNLLLIFIFPWLFRKQYRGCRDRFFVRIDSGYAFRKGYWLLCFAGALSRPWNCFDK